MSALDSGHRHTKIMTKLEELKAVEDRLYAELQEMEKPLAAKKSEWNGAFLAVRKAERFAQLDAEYAAAKLKEQANKTTE